MLADPTWGTLAFWVPLYLMTERGFDIKQIALFAWLPFVTADIGCHGRADHCAVAAEARRRSHHGATAGPSRSARC